MSDTVENILMICCAAVLIMAAFAACFYITRGSYDKATFEAVVFFGMSGVIRQIIFSDKLRRIDKHILEGQADSESVQS